MCLGEAFEGLGAGFHPFLLKTVGNMQGLTSEFPKPTLTIDPKASLFLHRDGKVSHVQ